MASRQSASLTSWRRRAVRRIAASRRSTLAFVAGLPVRETLRPRTQDRWSIKDVLAHLLAYDEETVRRFELIARGRGNRIQWFESMGARLIEWLPAPGWTHEQDHLNEVKAWWRAERHRR